MLPKNKANYGFSEWRPDKIITPVDSTDLKIDSISIVGKFPLPSFKNQDINEILNDGIVRTCSDHFGLFSQLSIL